MIKDMSGFLNKVRETQSNAYQTAVPLATATNITDVGSAVLGLGEREKNEFMNAINKIAKTVVSTLDYQNKLRHLRKEKVEFGSTIEDLFIELVDAIPYIAGTREGEEAPDPFEIFKTSNKLATYYVQHERQYAQTYHRDDIKRAFTSHGQFSSFLVNMAKALMSSVQLDDYYLTIGLIARQIEEAKTVTNYKGFVPLVTLFNTGRAEAEQVTAQTALQNKDFLQFMMNSIKKWSNRLEDPRSDLNIAGVKNAINKNRQRIMMLDDIQADLDTTLFAWAYNEQRLEIGGFDTIGSWYSIGADTTSPTPTVTPDMIEAKSLIAEDVNAIALIYDPEMIHLHNKFYEETVAYNPRGLYWTTYVTVADIAGASPFTNFVVFTLD